MVSAIHIEFNALFFLILCIIAFQNAQNVNQQMNRLLFRYLIYGILTALALDSLWMLIEGKMFYGAVFLNRLVNALLLATGPVIGSIWYLYTLETLGYRITRRLEIAFMIPGMIGIALNLLSIFTGWSFYITEDNLYMRGPLFWLQITLGIGMLMLSFFHILIWLLVVRLKRREVEIPWHSVRKLLGFYIIPVIGTLLTVPFPGMPGTLNCASVSIILIYIESQDEEILRDSLTNLNNRKTLDNVFADYCRQITPGNELYLLMMDLDNFKSINDSFGHSVGDQALVASAQLLTKAVSDRKAIVTRYGGDEFLIMGFFSGEEDLSAFTSGLGESFAAWNEIEKAPYELAISIGSCAYMANESLASFIDRADAQLYQVKREKKAHAELSGGRFS